MATIGISEFTFGYAFLYEQTRKNWTNLKAAPVLPSLQKEKDAGWDAELSRRTICTFLHELSSRRRTPLHRR
jgi:hypothetical protein